MREVAFLAQGLEVLVAVIDQGPIHMRDGEHHLDNAFGAILAAPRHPEVFAGLLAVRFPVPKHIGPGTGGHATGDQLAIWRAASLAFIIGALEYSGPDDLPVLRIEGFIFRFYRHFASQKVSCRATISHIHPPS